MEENINPAESQQVNASPAQSSQEANTSLATASLVLSILSFVCLSICGSIPGVICGHIAMGKIKKGEAGGEGLAKAGLIVGYINIGLSVIGFIIWIILVAVAVAGAAAQQGQMN